MAYLLEPHEPVTISADHQPTPRRSSEELDSQLALTALLQSDGVIVHQLGFGSHSTVDFGSFGSSFVRPLPTAGKILVSANSAVYLPNDEGNLGDIAKQGNLESHALPGVVIGADTDVLVIAQRLQSNGQYAATGAIALVNLLELESVSGLRVNFGAY